MRLDVTVAPCPLSPACGTAASGCRGFTALSIECLVCAGPGASRAVSVPSTCCSQAVAHLSVHREGARAVLCACPLVRSQGMGSSQPGTCKPCHGLHGPGPTERGAQCNLSAGIHRVSPSRSTARWKWEGAGQITEPCSVLPRQTHTRQCGVWDKSSDTG